MFHSKNDPVLRLWYRIGDFPDFDTALGYSGPEDPASIMNRSQNVRVVNCKDIVASHGGYRSAGQVWSFMAQELATPTTAQFITLTKTTEALKAVFRVTGGTESMRMAAGAREKRRLRARRLHARGARPAARSSTSRRKSRKRA